MTFTKLQGVSWLAAALAATCMAAQANTPLEEEFTATMVAPATSSITKGLLTSELGFNFILKLKACCLGNDLYATGDPSIWGSEVKRHTVITAANAKEKIFSDSDLKRLFAEFDKISQAAEASINNYYKAHPQELHDIFFKEFSGDLSGEWRSFLRDDKAVAWARENWQFSDQTVPLLALAEMLKSLAPYKYSEGITAPREPSLVLGKSRVFERREVSSVLESDAIKPLLPSSYNTEELRRTNAKLEADAEELFKNPHYSKMQVLDRPLWGTEVKMRLKMSATAFREEFAQLVKKAELLAYRFSFTSNEVALGRCDTHRQKFNFPSIEISNGDWTKVKLADGSALAPADMAMTSLVFAYGNCLGTRNTALTKRTLEAWVNGTTAKTAASVGTYVNAVCQLAQWSRFGIGGDKSETAAQRWEDKLRQEGEVCRYQEPIDPADPWRVLQ